MSRPSPESDRPRPHPQPPRTAFPMAAGLVGLVAAAGCGGSPRTVMHVDLPRYMGRWYEIARYPNRFEKDCVAVTADYTLREDGKVDVVNACRVGSLDGKKRQARAWAKVVDKDTNAKLKVYFFWPFGGDYWILRLGDEYDFAAVGSPNRKYLWILSRAATMDEKLYDHLTGSLAEDGFDREKLVRTLHPAGPNPPD